MVFNVGWLNENPKKEKKIRKKKLFNISQPKIFLHNNRESCKILSHHEGAGRGENHRNLTKVSQLKTDLFSTPLSI